MEITDSSILCSILARDCNVYVSALCSKDWDSRRLHCRTLWAALGLQLYCAQPDNTRRSSAIPLKDQLKEKHLLQQGIPAIPWQVTRAAAG